jgi:signal transduction histidine kinase
MHGNKRPGMASYGVAVLSVATALVIGRVLDIYMAPAPVSLFLCAVMFSAWFGGAGPGALAVTLSLLGFIYDYVEPGHTFAIEMKEVPRIVIFLLSAVFVLTLSAAQRRATETLRRTNETLEDLAGKLIHAQEGERRRIGRELHDHISQTLGVLTIEIDQLRTRGEITPVIGGALDELRRHATDITSDVHRLSHRLHSSTLDYLGLVPALQKLATEFSERHGISIALTHAPLPVPLPPEVALSLFRVAEEALTNIAKHSNARSAAIHVTGGHDGIHLRVEDAGAGFDMNARTSRGGLGFVSMQERLRILHGTFHVESSLSRGTRIDARVPASALTKAAAPEARAYP